MTCFTSARHIFTTNISMLRQHFLFLSSLLIGLFFRAIIVAQLQIPILLLKFISRAMMNFTGSIRNIPDSYLTDKAIKKQTNFCQIVPCYRKTLKLALKLFGNHQKTWTETQSLSTAWHSVTHLVLGLSDGSYGPKVFRTA